MARLDPHTLHTISSFMVDGSPFDHLSVLQAHEMCALLILGEIHSPALINASNSALQM